MTKNLKTSTSYIVTILVLSLFLSSCKGLKEKRISRFFQEWEEASIPINKKEYDKLSELEKSTYDIAKDQFCRKISESSNSDFPLLQYQIINNNIRVSLCEYFTYHNPGFEFLNENKLIFKDSIINVKPECNDSQLKLLFVSNKFKKRAFGSLKYGFGSVNEGENKKNARAILEAHYSNRQYGVPFVLDHISFNRSMDSAYVVTGDTYSSNSFLYLKESDNWVLDRLLSELIE